MFTFYASDSFHFKLDEAFLSDYWCICLYYLHIAPEYPEDGKVK